MVLRAARRRKLPRSSFAYPRQRRYPIDTVRRARNALTQSRKSNTFGSYGHVARAVRRKWGNRVATVGRAKGTVSGPGYRKSASSRKRSTRRK